MRQTKKDELHWPEAFMDALDKPVQRVNMLDIILPEEALSSFKFSEMNYQDIWNLINNWK